MRCSICREEIHSAEVAFAQHAGCCTPERKLLGYRVVRENPQTGEREWADDFGEWVTMACAAFTYPVSDAFMAESQAHTAEGRVVRVYLRIVRKRKGGA